MWKTFFFKVCPKYGKIRGFRTDTVYHKILFPLVGLAALAWVLIRVVPKPSRASYPCQQAAIPVATTFLGWLLGTTAGVYLLKKSRQLFSNRKHRLAFLLALVGALILSSTLFVRNEFSRAESKTLVDSIPAPFFYGPNQPIGQAKGLYPGRVTWVRDVRATPWDGKTGKWWEAGNIDETVLARMYANSLKKLVNASSDVQAWDKLFRTFNSTHGRGNRGWKPGEVIAVKVNCNNTYAPDDVDNDIDQSPQATRALLRQLIQAGIRPQDILVYDASIGWKIRALPDRVFVPLHREFPLVRWMDAPGSPGREKAVWATNAITYTSPEVELGNELPSQVVDAPYLINVALLKGHEISGVTLCAKNHFGSIKYPYKDHGKYVSQFKGVVGDYSAYVDLMGSPNLGGKTMLYIVDGLYGMQTNVGAPQDRDRWRRLFHSEWSASYFMSQDPVAIESVCLDFLWSEFRGELGFSGAKAFPKGSSLHADNYLIEAAKGINAKLGPYKPNGVAVGSLGVHEHWNNATEKRYTGKKRGIELVTIH
jgi:hypothetical protein